MKSKKHILVTGAAGSVGLEVIHELVRHPDSFMVTALDRQSPVVRKKLKPLLSHIRFIPGDILDKDLLQKACQGVDIVIHLAAMIPPMADKQPERAYKVNVEGTRNLIDVLENDVPNAFLLYASSISVYGDRIENPWIRVDDPLTPSDGDAYAHTKIRAEELIKGSSLRWSIFRLTAIMGPQTRLSPLFFEMPLETCLEIATARDTGFAFVQALRHQAELNHRIFNLSGGAPCRTTYRAFLERIFPLFGFRNTPFPSRAFAKKNFHCGYYADSDKLQKILAFQRDSLEDYYTLLEGQQRSLNRFFVRVFQFLIKKIMLQQSAPYKKIRSGKLTGSPLSNY